MLREAIDTLVEQQLRKDAFEFALNSDRALPTDYMIKQVEAAVKAILFAHVTHAIEKHSPMFSELYDTARRNKAKDV